MADLASDQLVAYNNSLLGLPLWTSSMDDQDEMHTTSVRERFLQRLKARSAPTLWLALLII